MICLRNFCDNGLVMRFHDMALVPEHSCHATGAPGPGSGISVGPPMRTDNWSCIFSTPVLGYHARCLSGAQKEHMIAQYS